MVVRFSGDPPAAVDFGLDLREGGAVPSCWLLQGVNHPARAPLGDGTRGLLTRGHNESKVRSG